MSGCRRDAKLCTAAEALAVVEDGQTIATGGFVGAGVPEARTATVTFRARDASNQSPSEPSLQRFQPPRPVAAPTVFTRAFSAVSSTAVSRASAMAPPIAASAIGASRWAAA